VFAHRRGEEGLATLGADGVGRMEAAAQAPHQGRRRLAAHRVGRRHQEPTLGVAMVARAELPPTQGGAVCGVEQHTVAGVLGTKRGEVTGVGPDDVEGVAAWVVVQVEVDEEIELAEALLPLPEAVSGLGASNGGEGPVKRILEAAAVGSNARNFLGKAVRRKSCNDGRSRSRGRKQRQSENILRLCAKASAPKRQTDA